MFSQLSLLQLIDSAFPTGTFSHSFGLETALQENKITNPSELSEWLMSYLSGNLIPMEGAAVYWAYRFSEKIIGYKDNWETDEENLKQLDQRVTLAKLARESREGGSKIGKRYLHMVRELYPEAGLERYDNWIQRGDCFGNTCVVHGWINAYLGHTSQVAVTTHLYAGINSFIQNSIRAIAIGQTEGQKVLKSLLPIIDREAEKLVMNPPLPHQLSSHTLMQEIGAMRHETLYSRLFMS